MVLPVISLEIVLEGFKFEKYVRLVQNNISATRQRGLVLELAKKNNGEAASSEVMVYWTENESLGLRRQRSNRQRHY